MSWIAEVNKILEVFEVQVELAPMSLMDGFKRMSGHVPAVLTTILLRCCLFVF